MCYFTASTIWHSYLHVGMPCVYSMINTCNKAFKLLPTLSSMFLIWFSVQNLLPVPEACCALSCLCSGSFLYLEVLSLPQSVSSYSDLSRPPIPNKKCLEERVCELLPTWIWFGLGLQFSHLPFLSSLCFLKTLFMGCLLDALSDDSSCLFSWNVRFWTF